MAKKGSISTGFTLFCFIHTVYIQLALQLIVIMDKERIEMILNPTRNYKFIKYHLDLYIKIQILSIKTLQICSVKVPTKDQLIY